MVGADAMRTILAHAARYPEVEICGVVVDGRFLPCRNICDKPHSEFAIHPLDWVTAENRGEIQAIVHSHPFASPEPSQPDRAAIEKSGLPWIIVNPQTGQYTFTKPTGYRAPLIGREFCYGVLDCYALAQDWYAEHGVMLPDVDRKHFGWWDQGENLFVENFARCGFEAVPLAELREGDAVLMQIRGPVPNHCAVYLGNNVLLHHLTKRLSSREVYGGYYLKHTTHALRHREFEPC